MIQLTVKEIRPNTSVNFFEGIQDPSVDQSIRDYFFENYIETGKLIATEKNLSEDGLTLTKIMIWNSDQDRQDFIKDPFLIQHMHSKKSKYNAENNIIQFIGSIESV
jgi:hypothetical protein